MASTPKSHLEQKLQAKLDSRKSKSIFRQLTISSPDQTDFSSNDFLSFSHSPVLRAAFLAELKRNGSFPLGSGGSRLLDGNSTYADNLEKTIAQFHGAEAGLLWNSGFDANAGVFSCVPQPGDIIVYDELIHASVHDGMKLSRAAKKLPFAHNSVDSLCSIIEDQIAADAAFRTGENAVFIAVESVYSMDGDIAPLREIVDLVDSLLPHGNGHIIIDEAHGTGVLGPLGKGLVCELGLEHKVFARLHTFGKSLACGGAIVLCSPLLRSYLVNYARPLIYTTFMPFPSLAAIAASYELLRDGHAARLLTHLRSLVLHFHTSMVDVTAKHARRNAGRSILHISEACPRSPIFALETDNCRSLAKHCQENGFMVRAVVPPTVPTRRVRVCLHAGNTFEEVDAFVERVGEWLTDQAHMRRELPQSQSQTQTQTETVVVKAQL